MGSKIVNKIQISGGMPEGKHNHLPSYLVSENLAYSSVIVKGADYLKDINDNRMDIQLGGHYLLDFKNDDFGSFEELAEYLHTTFPEHKLFFKWIDYSDSSYYLNYLKNNSDIFGVAEGEEGKTGLLFYAFEQSAIDALGLNRTEENTKKWLKVYSDLFGGATLRPCIVFGCGETEETFRMLAEDYGIKKVVLWPVDQFCLELDDNKELLKVITYDDILSYGKGKECIEWCEKYNLEVSNWDGK